MTPDRPGFADNSDAEGVSGAGATAVLPYADIAKMTVTPCTARLIAVVAADVLLCAATAYPRRQPT